MSVHNFLIHQEKERLVSLADISPRIHVFPYYFHQKIPGAQPCCYVREGVAERLIAAASLLPADLQLVVLDGWRPYEVQLALYENIKSQVMTDHPQASPSDILEILHTFVAKPSQDIERPSPHMSGGAVDVTLGTEQGWLDMGQGSTKYRSGLLPHGMKNIRMKRTGRSGRIEGCWSIV